MCVRARVCVCVWDEGLGMLSARPSNKPQGTSVKEIIIFYLPCCDGRLWFKFTIVKETIQEAALLKVARGSRTCERTPTMSQSLMVQAQDLTEQKEKGENGSLFTLKYDYINPIMTILMM